MQRSAEFCSQSLICRTSFGQVAVVPVPACALLCSAGSLWSEVVLVPSSPLSYDAKLAADLWNASADVAGVPRRPQIEVSRELS